MTATTRDREAPWAPGELLERSLAYALGSVAEVGPGNLERVTPCAEWDLGELLGHLYDSLDTLHEGLTGGRIGLFPPSPGPSISRVRSVRARVPCSEPGPPGRGSGSWWANCRWTCG